MRKSWLSIALVAILVIVLAYAWIDGGREPLRDISQAVPVPATAAGMNK
jgi:hypothetical protein